MLAIFQKLLRILDLYTPLEGQYPSGKGQFKPCKGRKRAVVLSCFIPVASKHPF